ncbi:right-handed parallel beta-helix repeat-containing protein [Salipiger sp. 1_MG-2023]|uniref:right-handed parallel beta-helix repeat-containing protein n=1 Tax=Salipiger sp. 1_MG-2023 TaxID=3062665 RepID=UPI0026E423B4|nr:right-handed parallel beta-helix repeat-containing protein [Salipiger sp. 1_MG-2023]MDO6586994.1 right-handed parallel beta-helix repeat-containing protein [Salipiger sp. 1_MG-2023]
MIFAPVADPARDQTEDCPAMSSAMSRSALPGHRPAFCHPGRRHVLGGLAAICAAPLSAAPSGPVIDVADADALLEAAQSATPGTTLRLAPGRYGAFKPRGAKGSAGQPITLVSADPASPARLGYMLMDECAHVVLDGLVFDYHFDAAHKMTFRPFTLRSCENVTLTGCLFDGDTMRSDPADTAYHGYGWALGLSLTSARGITLRDSEIRGFGRGLVVADCHDLTITGNDLHDMRLDGMNFARVSDMLLENNHIHDFRRAPEDKGHPDMIQFWTRRTTAPTERVTIRRNLLNSGLGPLTQSIFMRNEEVDTGAAGREMFYRDLLIEENVIINAHLHGITVGETLGLTIRNNTLIHNARSDGAADNPDLYTPRITVKERSEQVRILRNLAYLVPGPQLAAGWEIADNVPIQDRRMGLSTHYDKLFVNARGGNPQDLASFRYRQDGPLAGAGLGASWLDTAG